MRFLDENDARRMVWEACESPIEQFLCTGLFALLGLKAAPGDYVADRLPELAALGIGPVGFLFAQHPVGRYRLDFLVVAIDPARRRARLLGIECDGRAYHSSPDQIERDNLREREIRNALGASFTLLRYRGTTLRHSIRGALNDVSGWLERQGVAPTEGPGFGLVDTFTPGKPDLREPYRDDAAEDEALRQQLETNGFV